MENKEKIKELALEMLERSFEIMKTKVDKALKSGAVDIDGWDGSHNFMLLPKSILIAILEDEADQYKATGTSFEKQIKKEVKDIKYFL